jgi:hypothetical protein
MPEPVPHREPTTWDRFWHTVGDLSVAGIVIAAFIFIPLFDRLWGWVF